MHQDKKCQSGCVKTLSETSTKRYSNTKNPILIKFHAMQKTNNQEKARKALNHINLEKF